MNIVELYLRELHQARAAGVAETSAYPALAKLLNAVGDALEPKVRCVINLRDSGAGLPDGGLFTADQLRGVEGDPLADLLPGRGAIEAKGATEEVAEIAEREQVRRYLDQYGQVLVTSYREFLLLDRDERGRPRVGERFTLAGTADGFWSTRPRTLAAERGPALVEYLTRVLLHPAPLTRPQEVAVMLAAYAREARLRVDQATLPALGALRDALAAALGITFTAERGDHFFRATLVQTLFYGVFSAWVLWCRSPEAPDDRARFDWRAAEWTLHVPLIAALYHQIAAPHHLGPLKLVEVLEWTADALNRVDRVGFFAQFQGELAVQYFYEPFLEAYDPALRKELGVWYTPPEIVEYMVERVDRVLREELGLPDGLADPNVYVLDPCCGTGAYLVEVLKRIVKTKQEQGELMLAGLAAKEAATARVFGFEILPAPFVVAHLQLGMLLQNLGAGLDHEQQERVGVYLTNALTGWDPADGAKQQFSFPEFAAERDAAREVKQDKPILVVLGNPPYNAFAGVAPEEEQGVVEPYKDGLIRDWGIRKFNLDDLYVRFFRIAERRIAERSGRGVVSYVTNSSWVNNLSFVVMREHLQRSFDHFWLENLHGNREISERAPDGRTSETVFAIPGFSEGIRRGVVISTWVKTSPREEQTVHYRDDLDAARATERRRQLVDSLADPKADAHYRAVRPAADNFFAFCPTSLPEHFRNWPRVVEFAEIRPFCGVVEKRRGAWQSLDRGELEARVRAYFDPAIGWDELRAMGHGFTHDMAAFDAQNARERALREARLEPEAFGRLLSAPFDRRWCYPTTHPGLWNRARPEYQAQVWPGNRFLVTRRQAVANPEGVPFYAASLLGDDHAFLKNAYYLPFRLRNGGEHRREQIPLFASEEPTWRANVSAPARAYLGSLGLPPPDDDLATAELIWLHCLAIGYSPSYLEEYANGVHQDWPRVPLPNGADHLRVSAALGARLADLLDPEIPVVGVTSGTLPEQLRPVAELHRVDGAQFDWNADLALTAGWGQQDRLGRTTARTGRAEAGPVTLPELGDTVDVYLNDRVCWRAVPEAVWGYRIGGFQVLRKWLSYRERAVLSRDLHPAEAREFTHLARRLAGVVLLEPELEANYEAVKQNTYDWPASPA